MPTELFAAILGCVGRQWQGSNHAQASIYRLLTESGMQQSREIRRQRRT